MKLTIYFLPTLYAVLGYLLAMKGVMVLAIPMFALSAIFGVIAAGQGSGKK